MAYELGEAYISISMASGGLAGKIRKEIGIGSDEGTRVASSNITSRFSGAFKAVGRVGAAAIGTVGAALTGMAVGGGLNRALQIDNARASLKGLKLSMQDIDSVMKSANDAVDGTAFGLGEAAGAAATLKAAGVGVGDEMTRQLTIIADAATQSGKEIGSLSPIWSKMAADGRVTLGNLSQLTFNQVPAVAALAEHFGKTQAEIRKMASTGQISFKEFSVAMEQYIGGAAKASGETFAGAMRNVRASISRIGEKALTPFLNLFRDVSPTLIKTANTIRDVLIPVFDSLGVKLQAIAPNIIGFFQNLGDKAKALDFSKLREAGPVIVSLSGAILPLLGKLPLIGGAFAGITGPVGILVTTFGYLLSQSPELREMFGTVLQTALQTVSDLLQTVLIPALSNLLGFLVDHPRLIMAVVTAFAGWMAINGIVRGVVGSINLFTQTVQGATTMINGLSRVLGADIPGKMSSFGAALSSAKTAITGLRTAFAALNTTMLTNPIFLIVAAIAALVAGFIYLWNTSEGFRNFWIGLWEGIQTAFMAVWDALSVAFTTVWESVLKPVFDAIVNVVQVWWNTWMAIFGFISAAWNTLLNFLTGLWVLYGKPLFEGIGAILNWLWTTVFQPILQLISDQWNLMLAGFGIIWETVGKPVFDAIGAVLGWLWTGVFQPLLGFIAQRWNDAIEGLVAVWNITGKPLFEAIGAVLNWLWITIFQPILNTIGKAWDGFVGGMKVVAEGAFKGISAAFEALGHALEWVWLNIIKPVWDVISGAFKAIGDWFSFVTGEGAKARGQASFSAAPQAAFAAPVASYAAVMPQPMAAFATPFDSPVSQLASSVDRLGESERGPRGEINIELHNQPDYLIDELTRQLRWLKVA